MAETCNQNLENKIFEAWTALAAAKEEMAAAGLANILRGLKYFVAEKINLICGKNEGLCAYDVKIYDSYMRIISAYREVAGIYADEARPIVSPYAKGIWDGIYAVLSSRLSEESMANPIGLEKKEIGMQNIRAAMEWVNSVVFEALTEEGCAIAKLKHAPLFYQIYAETAQKALAELNDLSSRPVVFYYVELLKEEQEILRQILVVQVMALENFILDGEPQEGEEDTLQEALGVLREVYQRESAEIHAIDQFFNLGRANVEIESEADFAADFDKIVSEDLPDELAQDFAEKQEAYRQAASELFLRRALAWQNQISKKAAYFCKKAASALVQMVGESCRCFGAILEYYEENKEVLAACESFDIIGGVAETILIKLESLEEAVNSFEQEADGLIAGFSQNQTPLEPDFRLFDELDECLTEDLADEILSKENFADFRDLTEKALAKKEAELAKKTLVFKRDSFLFELTTFEEIMFYSVSRLRDSACAAVLTFVEEIDNQHKTLGDVLTKYGIEKIAPNPHDLFNPKENEVLMAEENEAFKKGEIIKTMNAGYRQGDLIIVRANVIAAK